MIRPWCQVHVCMLAYELGHEHTCTRTHTHAHTQTCQHGRNSLADTMHSERMIKLNAEKVMQSALPPCCSVEPHTATDTHKSKVACLNAEVFVQQRPPCHGLEEALTVGLHYCNGAAFGSAAPTLGLCAVAQ
jgi:hypothetical protein